MTEKLKGENIVKYHKTLCKTVKKVSSGDVLGYVTPVSVYCYQYL